VAAETTSADGKQPRGARSSDLRERKRTRTRLMIQTEALRLFRERGYAETTVEQIADAAAISPRTFFRYFPSKEDVVMWDEYDDPVALDLLEQRPPDEPLVETLLAVIRQTLAGLHQHDPARLLARVQLMYGVPELRARFVEAQTDGIHEVAQLLGRERELPADDLSVAVVGSALLGAVSVALDRWQKDEGRSDLLALLDRATDALGASARDLAAKLPG
jgi:AcrR family transcriptional regulator